MTELSLLAAAAEAPTRDCLIADGKTWSYGEVAARVRAALARLASQGVTSGQRVALTPRVDVDSAVWLYALFELGCPVLLLHPRLTERERSQALDEAEPVLTIRDAAPLAAEDGPERPPEPVPPERILAIVQTSGTGGRPRAACLSRRAFIASERAHASNLGWSADDRWLLSMPLGHVGGLSILTRCLIARRCAVLSPGRFDPAEVLRVSNRDRVTLLSVVPTMLRRLLACEDPRWAPGPELRAVLVGGAPFPEPLRREAAERGIPVLATYGCTEACSQVSTQTLDQVGNPGSGGPLQGVELRVVDGEIRLRGEMLMDGYLDEARGAKHWAPDAWFRTGDSGELAADGQLLVRGRLDELILTGGENVAPQEVEAWLETVPGVLGACAFSLADEEWGERLVAAITIDPSRYVAGELRARLAEGLAPHKRPKQIGVLDAMPLNRSGKVDRAAVAELCRGKLRPI